LVIAEVVGLVKAEVLSHVLHIQTEGYTSVEDHVELRELLAFLDDGLVGDEHSAVQLSSELTPELLATVLFIETKYSTEVLQERLGEELLDESRAKAGLELIEEFIIGDQLLVVILDGLVDVDFNLLVEHLGKLFTEASVIQFNQPDIH